MIPIIFNTFHLNPLAPPLPLLFHHPSPHQQNITPLCQPMLQFPHLPPYGTQRSELEHLEEPLPLFSPLILPTSEPWFKNSPASPPLPSPAPPTLAASISSPPPPPSVPPPPPRRPSSSLRFTLCVLCCYHHHRLLLILQHSCYTITTW